MTKVTFEFDKYKDSDDLAIHQSANDMHYALCDIFNMCRSELRYGNEELSNHIILLLDRIYEESAHFIDL